MLASARTIGVIEPHLLRETINIDHVRRFNAKAFRQLLVEEFFANLLTLQFFPTADVDNLGSFGQRNGG